MTFKNDTDRLSAEESWQESLELMAEFGLAGPDVDSELKQHQIEVLEAGLVVSETLDNLESEPF